MTTDVIRPQWGTGDKIKGGVLIGLGLWIVLMATDFVISVPTAVRSQSAFGDGDLSNGEAWCDINSAVCVGSEPLTATDYLNAEAESTAASLDSTQSWWNPNDSTSNELSNAEGTTADGVGHFIDTYAYKLQPSTQVTTICNTDGNFVNDQAYDAGSLPNRVASQAPRFLGLPNDTNDPTKNFTACRASGQYFLNAEIDASASGAYTSSVTRRAFRWYVYYSDDWAFVASGEQNTKTWESINGGYWSHIPSDRMGTGGTPSTWNCNGGATSASGTFYMGSHNFGTQLQDSDFVGKWWRYEVVIDNAQVVTSDPGSGNGVRFRWYAKNVSDDTAEEVWLDTYNVSTEPNNTNPNGPRINNAAWNCAGYDDLYQSGEDFNTFKINSYSQSNSDTGTPQKGYAFLVLAAWTDAQCGIDDLYGTDVWNKDECRIGSAYEMEGVAGDTN